MRRTYIDSMILIAMLMSATTYAQVKTNLFHSPGDADHADALVSNPSGMGLGTPFQLTLDSQFEFIAEDVESETDLNMSIKLVDWLALGFGRTFGAGEDSLPLRFGAAITNGRSWSLGTRTFSLNNRQVTDLSAMFRPTHWLSMGVVLSDVARGSIFASSAWQKPTTTLGLTTRPMGNNHRLGIFGTLDSRDTLSQVGAQWFSRIFDRWEVGVTGTHNPEFKQQQGMISFRTLGPLSIASGTGIRETSGDTNTLLALSTRLRANARPHKPLTSPGFGGRATIATLEINTGTEYGITGWFSPRAVAPFLNTLKTLDALSRRNDLDGVLIKLGGFNGGWAQSEELRQAIMRLKERQKRVFVFLPFADLRLYAIATAADEIIATPTSGYDLTGVTMTSLHIKGLLDQLGVEAEFVTTGEHKTAPETFTKATPSPASRASQNNIVDVIFDTTRQDIASGRKVDLNTVDAWISAGIHSGPMLKSNTLVDHQLHLDQAERHLRKSFGRRTHLVSAASFLNRRDGDWGSKKQVAVLYVVGNIIDGKTPTGLFSQGEATGSTTFRNALRRLTRDSSVAGIVIRVDSPGGTISASDTMWRVLTRASRKKPIVVSFSDVAASGGYYVAVGAPQIFASQRTLTGSIGVFAGKFNFASLMRKWGIKAESFSRGPQANLFSVSKPWNPEQRTTMQKSIDEYDKIFQSRVAKGRNMKPKEVTPLAGGRVYMGSQAKAHRLVDKTGGLFEAILEVKRKAGLSSDLKDLVIAPSARDSGRSFSLPNMGASTNTHPLAQIKTYLEFLNPQFARILPLLFTLKHGQFFAMMPNIWHQP